MDEHQMALRTIFRRGYTDLGLKVPDHLKSTAQEVTMYVNKTLSRISGAFKQFGDAVNQLSEGLSNL